MKPPFAYYGGKTRLAPRIVELLPAHQHYVEPFAGSLAVLLAKPRARYETVNDLDGDLMTFWRILRDRPDELAHVCALTPHARAEYEESRNRDDCADLERARRVWALLAQDRKGSLIGAGWRFEVGTSRKFSGSDYMSSYVRRLSPTAERLAGVSLECRPASEIVKRYGAHHDVCLYVDPPYLGETRAIGYRVEMPDEDQHRAMAEALNECRAAVVLSGYDSPLYSELYDGWHTYRFQATTTLGDAQSSSRTEVLWSNRPLQGVGDGAEPLDLLSEEVA